MIAPPHIGDHLTINLIDSKKSFISKKEQTTQPINEQVWSRFHNGPITFRELNSLFQDSLIDAYLVLQLLWKNKAISLTNREENPDVAIYPSADGETLDFSMEFLEGPWKLSRFAFMHTGPNDKTLVESSRVPVIITILQPRAAILLAALSRPTNAEGLINLCPWIKSKEELLDLLFLFRLAGVIDSCNAQGQSSEDLRPDLQQWEFHDLLFHTRSRQGRHNQQLGADFRFRGQLSSQPVVKVNVWKTKSITLPLPSLGTIAISDPTFTEVLESRKSLRLHNWARPISLQQLGEFLFRTVRIRHRYWTNIGEFSSRPYPSGGSSYELEIYLTINSCVGLERGFYYYDPEAHSISLVELANKEMESLLEDAWESAARIGRPQVLITISSRFHRVSWKYSGMAYAAQLKNVGVLYQTFYLVATAMNLAGCALGLGNSARFCRLARTNYFEEGSIGEFMLGTPA